MSEGQSNQLSVPLNIRLKELYGLNDKQADFLTAYAETGNVSEAADRAGISRQCHYQYLAHNERYKEAYSVARRTVGDLVVEKLAERAIQGDTRKKFNGRGEPIIDPATGKQYEETYYDTVAQIFLAKSLGGLRDQDSQTKAGTNNVQVVVNLPEKEQTPTIEVRQQNTEGE